MIWFDAVVHECAFRSVLYIYGAIFFLFFFFRRKEVSLSGRKFFLKGWKFILKASRYFYKKMIEYLLEEERID